MVVLARQLVPYLADAVPGWFQATLALYDSNNREVAYADDYQFRPDPVLYYRVPQDGSYELEIRDSIYRGREDFVYRITLGEIPFLTNVFPLGIQSGQSGTVEVHGWNLPVDTITFDATQKEPGRYPISVENRKLTSNLVMFAVDSLPELMEQEPNNDISSAPLLKPPVIVNGRIDQPGDWDVFRFDGRAGGQVMLEVLARHLESPMDSLLKLTDADGKQLMLNDDYEDIGSGLTTHHADSQLHVTLPTDGSFFIHVGDTQKKGGPEYAYRLRISARRPDYELRVVPSTVSARPGATIPVTIHALRRDGFDQDIKLSLKDAPEGFAISGGWVPADQTKVQITLTVPSEAREEPYILQLEGRADIRGRELVRLGVPAEDMMQAFAYHHLVPAEDLVVYVTGKAPPRAALVANQVQQTPENLLKIPSGGMVRYQLPIPNRRSMDDVGVELSRAARRAVPGSRHARPRRPGDAVLGRCGNGQARLAGEPDPERLCGSHDARSQWPARHQTSRVDRHLPGGAVRSRRAIVVPTLLCMTRSPIKRTIGGGQPARVLVQRDQARNVRVGVTRFHDVPLPRDTACGARRFCGPTDGNNADRNDGVRKVQ